MTKIVETAIPVPLMAAAVPANKGAFHWSYEKLACLANGTEVFIIDTTTLEVIQVLSGHKDVVTHVFWLPCGRQFVSAESKLSVRDVISADASNHVVVWDCWAGCQVGTFLHPDTSTTRVILDMRIPTGSDLWVRTKVYILYSGNLLTVYDYIHGSSQILPIVGLVPEDQFFRFSCDPYHTNQYSNALAFLSADSGTGSPAVSLCRFWDCVKDIKIVVHRRLVIQETKSSFNNSNSSPTFAISKSFSSNSISSTLNNPLDASKRQIPSSSSIRKLVSDIIVGQDSSSFPTTIAPQQIHNVTFTFHPGMKDTVTLSTDTVVYLVNTCFMTVLQTFSTEKQGSLVQVIPTPSRPSLYMLHENGTLFLRKYVITGTHTLSLQLETLCYNENPRFSGKKTEAVACVIHPFEENSAIVYLNDGRLLKYSLVSTGSGASQQPIRAKKHLTTPSTPLVKGFGGSEDVFDTSAGSPKTSPIKQQKSPTLMNIMRSVLESEPDDSLLTLMLTRVTHAFGQFTCLKSLTGGILVAGTVTGFLIVLQISDNRLKALKKFIVHSSSPVSGIEFVSESEVLTYSNLTFSVNLKCELVLTELWTGASRSLKLDDPNHIQTIRVSPLGQYFVLSYKNGAAPCELWDVPRRQLIKTLPSKLPPITLVHWRPSSSTSEKTREEVFYMTDLGTFLFTFRVEGNRFLSATCVKLEHTAHVTGTPTALFCRDDCVFRADSNAVLVMYNTTKKTASPSTSIGRGPLLDIVKVPGQDNYVVQFSDTVVLWDFQAMKKIKTLHAGSLRASSVALLNDWVAYVPKGSNGVRLLPLNTNSPDAHNTPTFCRTQFPYFMTAAEKASRILCLVNDSDSTVQDFIQLSRELGSKEELTLWTIVHSKWTKTELRQDIDVFCERQCYKETLVKMAQCVWSTDFQKREEVANVLLWAGESEKAAEILLDAEPSDPTTYVLNGLKASVAVGSSNFPEQAKAVLKIIATNLIACGDTDKGLELLCLLQKHDETCKYVESTNSWGQAVLLSKTSLNQKNSEDSLCKYAQYLNSKKCAYKAASVYIYLEKYDRAVEVLFGARLRHLSYLLLYACTKQNVPMSISDHIKVAISLDFARFLFECGLQKESIQFCETLGEKGCQLKQELEILAS